MTRPRALLSLSLVTLGAMLGGLSLSGYYEPHMAQDQPAAASATTAPPSAPQLAPQGRLRFVALADDKPPAPAAKPKTSARAPATKPKPEVKERSEPKPRRPQQAAAPWPWNLFAD